MTCSTTQCATEHMHALSNDVRINIEVTTVGLPQTLTVLRLMVDAIRRGNIHDWMIDGTSCVYSESGDFVDDDDASVDHSTIAELLLLEKALADLDSLDPGLRGRVESEDETIGFDCFTTDRSSASSLASALVMSTDAYIQVNVMASVIV